MVERSCLTCINGYKFATEFPCHKCSGKNWLDYWEAKETEEVM